VEDSKEKAKEAMERMPEIRQLIYEADQQTRDNQRALFGAKTAASTARSDADEAKQIAEKASKVSSWFFFDFFGGKVQSLGI